MTTLVSDTFLGTAGAQIRTRTPAEGGDRFKYESDPDSWLSGTGSVVCSTGYSDANVAVVGLAGPAVTPAIVLPVIIEATFRVTGAGTVTPVYTCKSFLSDNGADYLSYIGADISCSGSTVTIGVSAASNPSGYAYETTAAFTAPGVGETLVIRVELDDGLQRGYINGSLIFESTEAAPGDMSAFEYVVFGWKNNAELLDMYIEDGSGDVPEDNYITAELTSPMGTVSSTGGPYVAPRQFNAALIAPLFTLEFAAHDSTGENAASLFAPMGLLAAFGGITVDLTAPTPTLLASGTVPAIGRAELSAPSAVLYAGGVVANSIRAVLSAPIGKVASFFGGSAKAEAPMGLLATSVRVGGVLRANVTAPMGKLSAALSLPNKVSATLIAPMGYFVPASSAALVAPMGQLHAVVSAFVAVAYDAYSVNLTHSTPAPGVQVFNEVTHYTNFGFDHILRFKNSYYGINATGIYLLGGATDDGDSIPYAIRTGVTDFKTTEKKTLGSAYIGGKFGPDATITVFAGEGEDLVEYPYSTGRGELAQNYRQKFGRGVKDRYFALGISADSGELMVDSLEFEVVPTTRKI